MKFRLALLGSFLFLGTALHANVEAPPAALGDTFHMVRYTDGTHQLKKNQNAKDLKKEAGYQSHVDVKYPELVETAEQRIYDYQFYLSQFAATNPSPAGNAAWTAALNRLMDTFSQNMTTWSYLNNPQQGFGDNPPIPFTIQGFNAVKGLFAFLGSGDYYQGTAMFVASNVRIIPVLNNPNYQLIVTAGESDTSLLAIEELPAQLITDTGQHTFAMVWEVDRWRFYSFDTDNRYQWTANPFTAQYNLITYVPFPEVPPFPDSSVKAKEAPAAPKKK